MEFVERLLVRTVIWRNEEVSRRAEASEWDGDHVNRRILRWLGYGERMSDELLTLKSV